ncbi:UbiA family prenyltransferase [Streptomyces sp. NPDC060035]|uniref:UbiA family prenyltransferase n=1 Tax=Streptomyces sp. NPDC060035 TaxID=3347044 RepID=UPI0036A7DBD0
MDTTDRPQVLDSAKRPPHPAAGLALSCHPGPVAAVTALVVALSVSSGLGGARCVLIGGAVLTGQLSVGWCNDAFDARRDVAAGRRGKPVARGVVSPSAVWRAAFAALLLCTALSLACGPVAGAVHLAGVVAAWMYNLRLKATVFSWLPYVIGFGSLPVLVALNMPGRPWPAWWVVTAGSLLGVGAHLGDVLPDIDGDLRAGIRGLPQRLGTTRTRLLLPVPLVAASMVLVLGPAGPPGWWGAVTLAAVAPTAFAGLVPCRSWRKAALAGAVAAASADVVLLLMRGTAIA